MQNIHIAIANIIFTFPVKTIYFPNNEEPLYNNNVYIIQPIHMTSMMLELILIAALGVILEWLAQANQSIGVQLHKLPSRNYDFDQLWMKLFLNPVMSIC